MARGNRAIGLWHYANALYDSGHASILAREAWRELDPLLLEFVEEHALAPFASSRANIEKVLTTDFLANTIDLDAYSLGDTDDETRYREWCLSNSLFLNPLNDIGPRKIGGHDILTCPSVVMPLGHGPTFHGFFNQVKQEYCSARYLAFAWLQSDQPHFSDKGVFLYNTLDYPSYGLATEMLKLAFRSLYSVLDKVAFLLNAYLCLGIPAHLVSLKKLWYVNLERKNGIRPEFLSRPNWPLRGLYWLSKDLYEDSPEFRAAIDPAAERISAVRNHLEHKYLKLHTDLWGGPGASHFTDDLAESISCREFEEMTLRLAELARAAIIYLSLGIHREERLRAAESGAKAAPPMYLDNWEDDWKR